MVKAYSVQISDEFLVEFDEKKLERAAKRRKVYRTELWLSANSIEVSSLKKQRILFRNVQHKPTKNLHSKGKVVHRDITKLRYEGNIAVGEAVYLGSLREVKFIKGKWVSDDYV